MKAIILAAGKGSRLNKYTKNLPKGMLEFDGHPLLYWQIKCLRECGIKDITVVKGYRAEAINYNNVKYYTNDKYSDTNMLYSLLCASSEFNDDIIVCYADILYEQSLIETLMCSSADFGVLCDTDWKDYWIRRYGSISEDVESFSYDENYNITSIGESNPDIQEIDARYIGLLKFSCKGIQQAFDFVSNAKQKYRDSNWGSIPRSIDKAYMTDLFCSLMIGGYEIKAIPVQKGWIEFDTNEDYEKACYWLKNGQLSELINIKK